MVGHLDDRLQGQEPELHVHVDEPHHRPKANAAVAEWFGEAPSNKKACAETADKDHCETFHADDEAYFDKVAVLDDADEGVRRRPRRGLQGLLGVGPGLDGGQGLSATDSGAQLATALYRRPRLRLSLLLAGPVGWLVIAYLGSLAVLFVAAFWTLDPFTGEVVHEYSLAELRDARGRARSTGRSCCGRSAIAAAVTVTDALLAFPIAFYMAKVASPRTRGAARRRGAHAAVVELPREGLRVAHDPLRGRDPQLGARAVRAQRAGLRQRRHLARLHLPVAAVHDPADLRRARADPGLAARRLGRPRRRPWTRSAA